MTMTGDGQPSLHTGAQTPKRRKVSSRPNAKAFDQVLQASTGVGGGAEGNRVDGHRVADAAEVRAIKARITSLTREIRELKGLSLAASKREAISSLSPAEQSVYETSTLGKQARTRTSAQVRAEAAERRLLRAAGGIKMDPANDDDIKLERDYSSSSSGSEQEGCKREQGDEAYGPDSVKREFDKLAKHERDVLMESFLPLEDSDDQGPCGRPVDMTMLKDAKRRQDSIDQTSLECSGRVRPTMNRGTRSSSPIVLSD